MIVYSSNFSLAARHTQSDVFVAISNWLSQKARTQIVIDPNTRSFRLPDRSQVQVLTQSDDYPNLASVSYSHPDSELSGRLWVMEIGTRKESPDAPLQVSVLLSTSEISARVATPIQTTRPRIVRDILTTLSVDPHTPGLSVRRLDGDSANALRSIILDDDRAYPIVVISPTADGKYLADPVKVQGLVIGLAEVVAIPVDQDTRTISSAIGELYCPWDGAIKIAFPPRRRRGDKFVYTDILFADDLTRANDESGSAESEVLLAVTHRMNLPNSWKHFSPSLVRQTQLTRQFDRAREQTRTADDTQTFDDLIDEAIDQMNQKDEEITDLRMELSQKEDELRAAGFELTTAKENFQAAMSNRGRLDSQDISGALQSALCAAFDGNLDLYNALRLLEFAYPDRIVVLDTAYKSAQDAKAFRKTSKACQLMWRLASKYWDLITTEGGDVQAREVFGGAYASKEKESLSRQGRKLRTFSYRGRDVFMEQHLKIGVKDTPHETWRMHFFFDTDTSQIVIGHCGKHLNF